MCLANYENVFEYHTWVKCPAYWYVLHSGVFLNCRIIKEIKSYLLLLQVNAICSIMMCGNKGNEKNGFLFVRLALKKRKRWLFIWQSAFFRRAASQTWTGDLRVTNALLYQLSYSGGLSLVYGVQNYSFIWENKKNPTIF